MCYSLDRTLRCVALDMNTYTNCGYYYCLIFYIHWTLVDDDDVVESRKPPLFTPTCCETAENRKCVSQRVSVAQPTTESLTTSSS